MLRRGFFALTSDKSAGGSSVFSGGAEAELTAVFLKVRNEIARRGPAELKGFRGVAHSETYGGIGCDQSSAFG